MKPTWIREVIDVLAYRLPEPLARAVVALLLVAVGLAVAWALGWLLRGLTARLLRFMGTPAELGDEERAEAPETELEHTGARLVDRIVFWFVFVFFLGGATSLLGFPIIGSWLSGLFAPASTFSIAILDLVR